MSDVTLRQITQETVEPVMNLEVAEDQRNLVAPNAYSIAEAHFEPKAWCRAIYADDEPVGFIMLFDDPDKPIYYLWRMMIGEGHQRKGYGRRAMELLVEYVRSRPNAKEILVSYVPGEGTPQPLYEGFGFEETGRVEGDEVVMRLEL